MRPRTRRMGSSQCAVMQVGSTKNVAAKAFDGERVHCVGKKGFPLSSSTHECVPVQRGRKGEGGEFRFAQVANKDFVRSFTKQETKVICQQLSSAFVPSITPSQEECSVFATTPLQSQPNHPFLYSSASTISLQWARPNRWGL